MKSTQKSPSLPRTNTPLRTDSQNSPLRRTYFRLRQLKQTQPVAKMVTTSPPKRHQDFYSHQQATINQSKIREKKLSSTASNFYSNLSRNGSRIGKLSSIQPKKDTLAMRKTFYSKRNSQLSPKTPDKSSTMTFGRTSLNFHKQDIWKNQNNNNYLNKYKIVKELGKGSFSTVFLAQKQNSNANNRTCLSPQLNPETPRSTEDLDTSIDTSFIKKESINARNSFQIEKGNESFPRLGAQDEGLVAIKVYEKFKMNKDPHKFKNIRKEINIMQNLDNEGVVKLYQSVQTLTKISLVVEYGGQQSLLQYVKKNYPLSLQTVRDFSTQLIKGINYLHEKNIVHRDIKLQNVLIHEGKIKLIDFGFSCLTHKSQKMTVICGTPNYMAPEVISRKEYIGQQADIWSFGVVVYALAEGRHPFKAESYNQLERLVNRGKFQFKKVKDQPFMDFVRRIMRVKGSERPSAAEILNMRWLKDNAN